MSVAARMRSEAGTPVPRTLLTRQEAAATLGISLRHFQRHVQPYVRCVYCGQLRLYRPRDLQKWAEDEACRGAKTA